MVKFNAECDHFLLESEKKQEVLAFQLIYSCLDQNRLYWVKLGGKLIFLKMRKWI